MFKKVGTSNWEKAEENCTYKLIINSTKSDY